MEVRNGEEKKKDKTRGNMFFVKGPPGARTNADAVSGNLANVNTNGYKSSRVTFEEVFSQNLRPRSTGFVSSLGSVVRSSAPSYTGARRSFIEDGFAIETRHRRREGSPDLFEAREVDELD
ncbi:hypothetical protein BKA70DRAFT_1335171 [Coprinopsis sp. MPI-PUGE-AT-0042]|nr:hypothetical protein BKA70DRAFT_1335171 [Coprinopsis sp. MPI-PUGE-AT-0042]